MNKTFKFWINNLIGGRRLSTYCVKTLVNIYPHLKLDKVDGDYKIQRLKSLLNKVEQDNE